MWEIVPGGVENLSDWGIRRRKVTHSRTLQLESFHGQNAWELRVTVSSCSRELGPVRLPFSFFLYFSSSRQRANFNNTAPAHTEHTCYTLEPWGQWVNFACPVSRHSCVQLWSRSSKPQVKSWLWTEVFFFWCMVVGLCVLLLFFLNQ